MGSEQLAAGSPVWTACRGIDPERVSRYSAEVRDYRNLIAWQRAHETALQVYEITTRMPREERYGLRSQIRSAAVSVSANIAEGAGRASNADFSRFLSIASGSASELQAELELAGELGFLADDWRRTLDRVHEVKRLLHALMRETPTPS